MRIKSNANLGTLLDAEVTFCAAPLLGSCFYILCQLTYQATVVTAGQAKQTHNNVCRIYPGENAHKTRHSECQSMIEGLLCELYRSLETVKEGVCMHTGAGPSHGRCAGGAAEDNIDGATQRG